mmetsp:Transcript_125092/g.315050  ORF Transcript_125092/g.315050 Transcript_125092/m.315050 type:complete len:316 (+) Transcript_125092:371-1318(+)
MGAPLWPCAGERHADRSPSDPRAADAGARRHGVAGAGQERGRGSRCGLVRLDLRLAFGPVGRNQFPYGSARNAARPAAGYGAAHLEPGPIPVLAEWLVVVLAGRRRAHAPHVGRRCAARRDQSPRARRPVGAGAGAGGGRRPHTRVPLGCGAGPGRRLFPRLAQGGGRRGVRGPGPQRAECCGGSCSRVGSPSWPPCPSHHCPREDQPNGRQGCCRGGERRRRRCKRDLFAMSGPGSSPCGAACSSHGVPGVALPEGGRWRQRRPPAEVSQAPVAQPCRDCDGASAPRGLRGSAPVGVRCLEDSGRYASLAPEGG